jgi:hypothetical protein
MNESFENAGLFSFGPSGPARARTGALSSNLYAGSRAKANSILHSTAHPNTLLMTFDFAIYDYR